jgi:hypothetical protein
MSGVAGLDRATHFGRNLWSVIEGQLGSDDLAFTDQVTVVTEPCPTQGQWSTTFVSVVADDRADMRFVVKQNVSRRRFDEPWRWGLDYEIAVYQHVLPGVEAGLVKILAHWSDPESGLSTLVMEQFVDAYRLPLSWSPEKTLVEAAQWMGKFHQAFELSSLTASQREILQIHSPEFIRGWFDRCRPLLEEAGSVHPPLLDLVRNPEPIIATLTESPQCVIHGDFSPNNVIVDEAGKFAVIDWESAAVGCGAVDLASLTLGWPDDVVEDCLSAYAEARWGGPVTADLMKSLHAGRIYHGVRSGRPGLEDLQREKGQRRIRYLRESWEAWQGL